MCRVSLNCVVFGAAFFLLLLSCNLSAREITIAGCTSVPQGGNCTMTFNEAVNVELSGGGSLSCTHNCKSTTFTAPPTVTAHNRSNRAGCPVRPIDSIFYTRIDS